MRYLLLTLLLSFSLASFANEELVVEQATGKTAWTISTIKDLTFDGKGVKISFNDNTSVYYAAETLSMIHFNATASGVNAIEAGKSITVEGDCVVVNGYEGDIKVYSLAGAVVAQGKGARLDISHLNEGTYVVKAGSLISKIIK